MSILVTGATGTVGSQVVVELIKRGANVRALVRDRTKATLPDGVTAVEGDFLNVDSMRSALAGTSTLFLLNAVVPDEFTQALIALNLAREAGIERIVYFSVLHADRYANVPHFAGKYAVERMIEQAGMSATILRPAYFIGNDASLKDAIVQHGVYPMPVGSIGLAMVDTRDIAEVAAIELMRREQAPGPLPLARIDIVGPEVLRGRDIAKTWSDVLGREIAYGGDDTKAFEQSLKAYGPSWLAYDMRTMAERFQTDGMIPEVDAIERLTRLLGRPLRSYGEFAREQAAHWLNS